MATLKISCIVACSVLLIGQASSARHDWLFTPRRDTYRSNLGARDWLYRGLMQEGDFHDFSLDSNSWIPKLDKLFPDFTKNVVIDESQYQVKVSMVGFTKDEISVRVKDGFLVISGKHEPCNNEEDTVADKKDTYTQFTYKYSLPEDTILEEMKSRLTSEGLLIVTAPRSGVKKVDEGFDVPVHADDHNAVPTTKKHNEFYDEDSAERTTQTAAEELVTVTPKAPVISYDGDYVKYEIQ